MENYESILPALDEKLIINQSYYEQLKDQLTCIICCCLLNDPLMCSGCDNLFCKTCIKKWKSKNENCPMRCRNFNTVEVHRAMKKTLDGLKLKCKYGCEVPLLSYNSHIIQCELSHKDDINCWNCGNLTTTKKLVQENMEDMSFLKQELENLKNVNMANQELIEENYRLKENLLVASSEIIKLKYEKTEEVMKEKEKNRLLFIELDDFMKRIQSNYFLVNGNEKIENEKEILNKLLQEKVKNDEDIEKHKKSKLYNIKNELKTNDKNDNLNQMQIFKENCFVPPTNPNILSKFEFSNNNKSVKMITTSGYNWNGLICQEKVPRNSKTYEFTIRIDNINTYADIMIGFCVINTNGDNGFRNTNTSWMCFLNNGLFFNAGDRDQFFAKSIIIKPKDMDIFSLCIELDTSLIYLKKNNQKISASLKMKINDLQKSMLIPCIDMADAGDKITIL